MGEKTGIGWTDHTFNPFWICTEVSPACTHCYAREWAERWGWAWGKHAARRVWAHDTQHWQEPLKWNRVAGKKGVRRRVFTASMADILDEAEDHRDPPSIGENDPPPWDLQKERAKLWETIEVTPNLDWQLLTKRPENYRHMLPQRWFEQWPSHVWCGTTTENAEQASLRWVWLIDLIERCRVRPSVLFASVEPIVGAIDFTALPPLSMKRVIQLYRGIYTKEEASDLAVQWHALWERYVVQYGDGYTLNLLNNNLIDWIITGGESGKHARPWHPQWIRSIRNQAHLYNKAFFHKQHGEWTPTPHPKAQSRLCFEQSSDEAITLYRVGTKRSGNSLDGEVWQQFPSSEAPRNLLPSLHP